MRGMEEIMERIYFSAWGEHGLDIPKYAMSKEYETKADTVSRAIARKNRLEVCAGPKLENTSVENDIPTAYNYQITLGRPVKTGGYSVEAQVWFSIPVSK